jgi:hypothetical protein
VRKQRPAACCCPWAGKRKEGSGPVAGSKPAGRGLGLKGRRGGLRVWKGFVFFSKPFILNLFQTFQTLKLLKPYSSSFQIILKSFKTSHPHS